MAPSPLACLLGLLAFTVYSCQADDCSVDKLCGCGAFRTCWKYTGEKLVDAPWCYTQPLKTPENTGLPQGCQLDSECDFQMTCVSEARFAHSRDPKEVFTPVDLMDKPPPEYIVPEPQDELKALNSLKVKQLAAPRGDGGLLLAVSLTNTLYKFDDGWKEVNVGPVKYVSVGFDNSLWIQTLDNKLFRNKPGNQLNGFEFVSTTPMVASVFSAQAFDHAFVVSTDNFAHRFIGDKFGETQGDDKQAFTQVALGKDNSVWAVDKTKTTLGQSIFQYDTENTQKFVLVDGTGQSVAVYDEKPNHVVIGNFQGLWLWKGKKDQGTSWTKVKGSNGCTMPAISEKQIWCIDQNNKVKVFDN